MNEPSQSRVPPTGRVIAWPGRPANRADAGDQTPRYDRRLVAILYADVAGYSRLTDLDEEGTHARLAACLDAVAAAVVRFRGTVKHYAGDAVLAQFDTVCDAVACALEIQRLVGSRSADLPRARRFEFRIGINVGDVIADRNDVYGSAVNVAARLHALAEPGGICVSEAVRMSAGNAGSAEYRFIGARRLKNIAWPVRVYGVYEPGRRAEGWLAGTIAGLARRARAGIRGMRETGSRLPRERAA